MDNSVILASVVVLAATSVNCSQYRASAAGDILSSPNLVAPSATPVAVHVATASEGGRKKPGGPNSTAGLTLVMYNDINGNGLPDWGDAVTFNVWTTETTEPHVDLTCSQNDVIVYGATAGYYESYLWPWTQFMTLSSTAWQGGAAECTAELYYFSGRRSPVLASISFTAGP